MEPPDSERLVASGTATSFETQSVPALTQWLAIIRAVAIIVLAVSAVAAILYAGTMTILYVGVVLWPNKCYSRGLFFSDATYDFVRAHPINRTDCVTIVSFVEGVAGAPTTSCYEMRCVSI